MAGTSPISNGRPVLIYDISDPKFQQLLPEGYVVIKEAFVRAARRVCGRVVDHQPLIGGQPDPAKLDAWKKNADAEFKRCGEADITDILLSWGTPAERVLETTEYGRAMLRKNMGHLKRETDTILEEIYAQQTMGAMSKELDAAVKKAKEDMKDKSKNKATTQVDEAKNAAESDEKQAGTLAGPNAVVVAETTKPSAAAGAPVAVQKSGVAATDDNMKKGGQRKKKSGFENGALVKAWLAGDD